MTVPGVLFDMDGTLIDTEPVWLEGQIDICRRFGVEWTDEDAQYTHGRSNYVSAVYMAERGVKLPPEEIIRVVGSHVAAAVAQQVPWLPGGRELLERVRAAGTKTALVTASEGFVAAPFLSQAGHLFDAVVVGEDVTDPKPAPEPYARGAKLLGLEPWQCVALEDSPSGISSAMTAGAATIGVERHLTIPSRPGLTLIGYLSDVTDEVLQQVLAANAARLGK